MRLPRWSCCRVLAFACFGLAASACHGRPRAYAGSSTSSASSARSGASEVAAGSEIAEIDLTRGAPETASGGLLSGVNAKPTFYRLVTVLREIAAEESSHAVLVRFGSAELGWARAQEIAGLFARIRAAKKQVVCHADGYSNSTVWVAAQGCDRIWVSPAGGVSAIGVAAELIYAHRLLTEKLGVNVDFLQIGKFKGAEEPFTRDGPSPEARASLESVLSALRASWLEGVSARGPGAREAIEDGPLSPADAKARGLVDEVGYLDEARDEIKKRSGGSHFDMRFGSAPHGDERPGLSDLVRAIAGGSAPRANAPHVVLVRAIGAISMEAAGGVLGAGGGISERGLGRTVRTLTEDDAVKAVVLRIDSPGGSALASDLLWRLLMQLRGKKPLIVSIGDMAASGGYYLASTATRIVAEPTSIVGSIGVVGGKLAFGPALENVGVHVESIAAPGAPAGRASYESALTPWDPQTRERVRREMTAIYDLFVQRVAEGRGLGVEAIAGAAEGRIFAGAQAKDLHLVDEWGGLEQAVQLAKELAHLDTGAPVRIAGEGRGLMSWLGDEDGDDLGADESAGFSWSRAARLIQSRLTAGAPGALALGPASLAFVASVSPLLHGEQSLAALPYVLLLH
jgi:protease-4